MKVTLVSVFLFLNITCVAQVGEIKERAKSYSTGSSSSNSTSDYNSSSSYDGGSDFLGSIVFDIFFNIGYGLADIHKYQLKNNKNKNWNTKLELSALGAFSENVVTYNEQSIKGQWGLFSTQIRRTDIHDVTGTFITIDWQLIQFNFFNNEYFQWLIGMGFSHEHGIDQPHFEWATELRLRLFNSKVSPQIQYRQSDDGYPRHELTTLLEYRPYINNRHELSFIAGYSYKSLYDLPFKLATIGMRYYLK